MPFVLVMPKAERDALRKGGGVPEAFWGSLSGDDNGPILAWPHELSCKMGRSSDGKVLPVDLPEFFGLGSSGGDDAKKRANERLLAPLMNRPMVLVAFLEKQEESGGFARFHSFGEIVIWAKQFDDALKRRHPGEGALGGVTRTLVLVARREQVRAEQKELEDFEKCVGAGRVFTSAYYMGRNLQMETGGLFHSAAVWDVMLARLLTAFVLSERETPSRPFYADPGLKLWRSSECLECFDADAETNVVNRALSNAANRLKSSLVPGGKVPVTWAEIPSSDKFKERMDDALGGGLEGLTEREDWRKEPRWGWSDFKAVACLIKTRDDNGARWRPVLNAWRRSFPIWRRRERMTAATDEHKERNDVYDQVHDSAANVSGALSELRRRLDASVAGSDPVEHWQKMAEAARDRARAVARMEADVPEFERAQARYAGVLGGVIVWMVSSLAFGWLGLWVALAGQGIPWMLTVSLGAFVCFSLGAFVAVAVVTIRHFRAGHKGMKSLIDDSLEADGKLLEQNEEARKIAASAVASEFRWRLYAERFRAWVLLNRLRTMLDTETSPGIAQGRPADGIVGSSVATNTDENDDAQARFSFMKETRTECNVQGLTVETEINKFVEDKTSFWWKNTFLPSWKELSKGDKQNAGHYPARNTVSALRGEVERFLVDLRNAWRIETKKRGREALKNQLQAWVDQIGESDPLQYASAASTGENTDEGKMEDASVYCVPELMEGLVQPIAKGRRGGYELKDCQSITSTPWLGLMYQEWLVKFDLVPQTHELKFKDVPDD